MNTAFGYDCFNCILYIYKCGILSYSVLVIALLVLTREVMRDQDVWDK